MSPQVAYMQILGLETLDVRYSRQAQTALEIARRLESVPEVLAVGYPGLESHPNHEIFRKLYGENAGQWSHLIRADAGECFKFIDSLKLIHRATNLLITARWPFIRQAQYLASGRGGEEGDGCKRHYNTSFNRIRECGRYMGDISQSLGK